MGKRERLEVWTGRENVNNSGNIGADALFSSADLLRSGPQGFLYLPLHPAVLLSSAWTKLSTATLLASNRLWPNSAAAKGVQLHQGGTQGPSLGLPKPLKAPPLGPQPDTTLREPPTTTVSVQVSWSSCGWEHLHPQRSGGREEVWPGGPDLGCLH